MLVLLDDRLVGRERLADRDGLRGGELVDGRVQGGERLVDDGDELRVLVRVRVAAAANGLLEQGLVVVEDCLGLLELLAGPADFAGLGIRREFDGGFGLDGLGGGGGVGEDGGGVGLQLVEGEQFVELAVRRLHRPHVGGQAVGRPRDERADAPDHQAEAEQQFVAQTPATGHREPPCSGRRAGRRSRHHPWRRTSPGSTGERLPEDFLQWEGNFYRAIGGHSYHGPVVAACLSSRLPSLCLAFACRAARSYRQYPDLQDDSHERVAAFGLLCFVSLFAVVEPLGLIPIFIGMTGAWTSRPSGPSRAGPVLVAFVTLLVFTLTGQLIFRFFGISVESMKVVGGIIFFLIGYEMLQARLRGRDSTRDRARRQMATSR